MDPSFKMKLFGSTDYVCLLCLEKIGNSKRIQWEKFISILPMSKARMRQIDKSDNLALIQAAKISPESLFGLNIKISGRTSVIKWTRELTCKCIVIDHVDVRNSPYMYFTLNSDHLNMCGDCYWEGETLALVEVLHTKEWVIDKNEVKKASDAYGC